MTEGNGARKLQRQVALDISLGKTIQVQFAGKSTPFQLQPELMQRMHTLDHLAWPIRNHDQQGQRFKATGDVSEQVNGRGIDPVDVLQNQKQRPMAAQFLQKGKEFALQSFL